MSSYTKSPDEIEQDILATRSHIDRTLDVLTMRLSPSGLVDQAVRTARETGGEFTLNLGRAVRDNPVPTALIGLGLGWLMVSGRRSNGAGYDTGYRPERVSDHAVGERHRYSVSESGVAPTSSVEARNVEVPDDWSAAYEDQPGEWVDAEGRPRSGGRAERAKVAAKDAYWGAKARAGETAADVRGSVGDASKKGSETVRGAAERSKTSARETGERLRDAGRDASDKARASARDASERIQATGRDASERARDAAERARRYGSDTADRAAAAVEEGRYRASEALRGAGDASRRASSAVRDSASSAYRRGGSLARSASDQAREVAGSAGTMAREHPIAVGFALAAAGAILASMAPRTRREDELLGEKSDQLKDAAREAASAQVERAREAASAAVDAGIEEARRKGLTPEGAKESLDKTVADGIGVAKTAARAGADTAKGEVETATSAEKAERDGHDQSLERKTDRPSAPTSAASKDDSSLARTLEETGRLTGVSGISTAPTPGGSFGSTMDSHPADTPMVDAESGDKTASAANRV